MRNRHSIIITIAFLAFAPLSKSAVQANRVFEHIKLQLRPVVDSAQPDLPGWPDRAVLLLRQVAARHLRVEG